MILKMRGMQLIRPGSLAKMNNPLSSIIRNASCSRGWLRLLVQSIFASVTVASFILIVLMAIPNWPSVKPQQPFDRCQIHHCRVVCKEAPFFDKYEDDIILAVSEANEDCSNVYLILDSPMFNDSTLPPNWLSRFRIKIHELTITNGNLKHVSPDAFMSQCTAEMHVLTFHNIFIKTWTAKSLVGLSNLRRLYFKECDVSKIPRNALRAVDDTLQSLTIVKSGHWDPSIFTGSIGLMNLTSVDFSFNSFGDVLGRTSFAGLEMCKILYLNSCKIFAIGAGAFNTLRSIEMIFLHNNYLVTIPPNLFSNVMQITNPRPRISLQDNLWHCDCSSEEIRKLIAKDMLLIDPVCNTPEYLKYKTFTEYDAYCSKEDYRNIDDIVSNSTVQTVKDQDISGVVYVSNECYYGNESSSDSSMKLFSPVYGHGCPIQGVHVDGINSIPIIARKTQNKLVLQTNWIKFTYFLKTFSYSMVEIGALEVDNYGIVWYQSTCPNEVYCVNDVPSILRIYNIDLKAHYIFCPILLSTGSIESENCVVYNHSTHETNKTNVYEILLYVGTGIGCLFFGALCVYALIRKHPHLLKGNKRILFVKHKTVDALVLPPKVPLRTEFINETAPNCNEKIISIMPSKHVLPNRFNRNISARSSKSSSPSYISALQPTEDQLAEWRIKHHFDNDLSITSISTHSELSTISWITSDDILVNYSLDVDSDRTYESLK